MPIMKVRNMNPPTVNRLLLIWETAVKATHDFLDPEDFQQIKEELGQALPQLEEVYIYLYGETFAGYLVMDGENIDQLFVDSRVHGHGIGGQLLTYAVENLGAKTTDVNQQNLQAVGFYHHMGFVTTGRSETDDAGRPYPILHLEYRPT